MAHVVITAKDSNISKIVFRNMELNEAKAICAHMNRLNEFTAERMGKIIKLVFKVLEK